MTIKDGIKVTVYIVLVGALVAYFSRVYGIKNLTSGPNEKISQSEVLFIGTSGFNRAISPMELFEKKGIASYNISSSWAQIPLNYYMVQEYAKNAKTKLIVLDMETFFDQELQTLDTVHYTTDGMPLDGKKISFVNDGAWDMSLADKIGFIAPLFRYHDRWSETTPADYALKDVDLCDEWQCYGYLYDYNAFHEEDVKYSIGDDYQSNHSLEYVLKIQDYCSKNNIELLLLLPPWQRFNKKQYDTLRELTKERGLKYEDFRSENAKMLDERTEYANSGHLNTAGAVKYSNFLTDYLSDNYDLSDYRDNPDYCDWKKDLETYREEKEKTLQLYHQIIPEARK
jgi:hypothetical protein